MSSSFAFSSGTVDVLNSSWANFGTVFFDLFFSFGPIGSDEGQSRSANPSGKVKADTPATKPNGNTPDSHIAPISLTDDEILKLNSSLGLLFSVLDKNKSLFSQ